jgi:TonB family protein
LKKFFFFSFTAHGLLFGGLIVLGTLISHPRMSYYSVDLVSSLPSGAPAPQPVAAPVEAPPVQEPPAVVPVAPVKVSPEAIKTVDKTVKKPRRTVAPPKPQVKAPPKLPSWAVANTVDTTQESSASPLGSNASAVSANAGPSFPYPWYMKLISDRLDKQWHPNDDALGTDCEVSFVIGHDGQVSNIKVSHPSGDPFFDQLAQHAVSDSNPMPPLPSGYPEPKLNVHMTFKSRKN